MPEEQSPFALVFDEAEDSIGRLLDDLVEEAHLEYPAEHGIGLAAALAAIVAAGDLLSRLMRPGADDLTEHAACCYLRGALRGADGPIDENGHPYRQVLNG